MKARPPLRLRAIPWVLAAGLLLSASPARAQEGGDREQARESARALAKDGYTRLEAGDFAGAITLLRRAESLFHAPTHLLYLARALRGVGRLAEAKGVYERIAGEELASYAPDAFVNAQREARRELDELAPRVPSVTVRVTGGGSLSSLRVDESAVEPAAIARPIDVEPGRHEIVAVAAGLPPQTRSIALAEGEHVEIAFQAPGAPEAPKHESWAMQPAIAALGLGVIGLGVGAVAGAVSASQVSDIRTRCHGDVCPTAERDGAETAATIGDVSTVGFVVGIAGAAAGGALLVIALREPPPDRAPVARVTAELRASSFVVRGSF